MASRLVFGVFADEEAGPASRLENRSCLTGESLFLFPFGLLDVALFFAGEREREWEVGGHETERMLGRGGGASSSIFLVARARDRERERDSRGVAFLDGDLVGEALFRAGADVLDGDLPRLLDCFLDGILSFSRIFTGEGFRYIFGVPFETSG